MALKETRNEETIAMKGDKFIYTQERVVELSPEDLLALATRERTKLDEFSQQISTAKSQMKRINDFLSRNKKLIENAKKMDDEKFCEACGMDFSLPANKGMKSDKKKQPYSVLCKNCATKQGL